MAPHPYPGSQSAPPWPGRNAGLSEGGDLRDGGLVSLPSSPAQHTLSLCSFKKSLEFTETRVWSPALSVPEHKSCFPNMQLQRGLGDTTYSTPTQREEGFPGGSVVKNPPASAGEAETWGRSLGQEDPQKKEMATHSSIPAWRIPWTEEPGGLQSMGSQSLDVIEHMGTREKG